MQIDSLIAALLRGVQERGMIEEVTLMLTSDHGMSPININRSVSLSAYTDITQMRIIDAGATLGIWPTDMSPANIDRIYGELYGKVPHMAVYRRSQIPEDLHYNNNGRIPPIVGMMDDTWGDIRQHGSTRPALAAHTATTRARPAWARCGWEWVKG